MEDSGHALPLIEELTFFNAHMRHDRAPIRTLKSNVKVTNFLDILISFRRKIDLLH